MRRQRIENPVAWLSNHLDYGKDKAVPRKTLCELSGLDDRSMRLMVHNARRAGLCVANDQSGKGYFLPANKEEVAEQLAQQDHRAKSILAYQKHLKALFRIYEDKELYTADLTEVMDNV